MCSNLEFYFYYIFLAKNECYTWRSRTNIFCMIHVQCIMKSWVQALVGSYQILWYWYLLLHTALRSKRKDWLARDQNNVFEWSDMSTCGLLFLWASTINIQLSLLVYYKADIIIIISSKSYLFSRHDMTKKLLIWCLTIIAHSIMKYWVRI